MMKIPKGIVAVALASAALLPSVGAALTFSNKSVGQLGSSDATRDCILFTLDGVAEANPVKPGDPWFSIPRAQFGSKDAYAMLLAGKLSGQPVTVTTNGELSCGYALVTWVKMQ